MSYYLVKNLRVNKETGVVSGDFADSNTYDYYNKHIYEHLNDIYQDKEGKRTPLQKYSRFISDIIAGNIQGSIGKYAKLSIPNYYDDLYYFMRENENTKEDPYSLTYLKYKEEIEKTLTEKPEYIIKINNDFYLQKLNKKTYIPTYMKENAKLFAETDFNRIKKAFSNSIAININTNEEINLANYERKVTPSEIEKNYNLKIPTNETFKDMSKKINDLKIYIDSLSNKNVGKNTITETFKEEVKKILNNYNQGEKAFFSFGRKTGNDELPNIITILYPKLNETILLNDNKKYFVGYKFKCLDFDKNISNEYDGGHLTISYLLDTESNLKKELYNVEKNFEKDVLNYEKHKSENEEESNKLDVSIKDWYVKKYPSDDLGNEINDKVTFNDIIEGINNNKNIYEILEVNDSLVRERIFEKISNLIGVSYEDITNQWLNDCKNVEDEEEDEI